MRAPTSAAPPAFIDTLADTYSFAFDFQALASACEIRLEGDDEVAVGLAARRAIDEVRRIERKYSRYRSGSIVSCINAAAGSIRTTDVDAETAALLDFATYLHILSDGLFDVTSGVLRRAWNFSMARLPDRTAVSALLPLIGWSQVSWRNRRIALPRKAMELDFGGFVKQYAADRAMASLLASGQRHGYIKLGGDIRVVGPRVDGRPWRFDIVHPRREGVTIATIGLREGALAITGDYKHCFDRDGRRYCQILDPRTGWPVSTWASISVTAPACAAAGALGLIAMLKGAQALDFLATQGASYLAIDTRLGVFRQCRPGSDRFDCGEGS
jgi:thiamine biosynthesis lipoprotein